MRRRSERFRGAAAVGALLLGIAATTPACAQGGRAPRLRVHGETLSWTAFAGQRAYRLLTRARGRQTVRTVLGRKIKPPAVPGVRVVYRVHAAHGGAWSNAVTIAYRRGGASGASPPAHGAPPAAGPSPGATSSPAGESPRSQAPSPEGHARYRLDARPFFSPFATARYVPWVQEHITMIKGYPPFSDIFVGLFGLPLIANHDPALEGQAPLAQAGIEAYLAEVRLDMGLGYAGVFVDDANWSAGFNPSPGPRANLANLIEAIRAAEPSAVIEINSQFWDIWPLMKAHDANVERALRYVNLITKEFGVGPDSGINTAQDYGEFMQFIDALHAKGIHTTMAGDPGAVDVATMEYNLATYFLINDGHDFVNGVDESPTSWWPGFDVNLGSAVGGRERSPTGLWTRRFSGGVVYTVEPGAHAQTIRLGRPMRSAEWGTVESVTLSERQGAVLVG